MSSHAAAGESIPPDRSASARPAERTGSPPGPGQRSWSSSASPCRRCSSIQSSGVSRSTAAPVAAWTRAPSSTASSCERNGSALSTRRTRTPKLAKVRPATKRSTSAWIASRVGAALEATLAYAAPNTRPIRSRSSAAGGSPGSSTSSRPNSRFERTGPSGASVRSRFWRRQSSKRGRFLPFRPISA